MLRAQTFVVRLPKSNGRKPVRSVTLTTINEDPSHLSGAHDEDFDTDFASSSSEPDFPMSNAVDLRVQLPYSTVAPSILTIREAWLTPFDIRQAGNTRLYYQPGRDTIDEGSESDHNLVIPNIAVQELTAPVERPQSGWSNPSRTSEPDVAQWDIDFADLPDTPITSAAYSPVKGWIKLDSSSASSSIPPTPMLPSTPFPLQVLYPSEPVHDIHRFTLLTRFSPPPHYIPA